MGIFSKNTQQNKNISNKINDLMYTARQGDVEAQREIADCYRNGDGVQQDYTEAVRWYRKASMKGDGYAQCKLGLCYLFGNGVEKDSNEAFKWLKKSVANGFQFAQYFLGLCYENGDGVTKDINEAIKCYMESADNDDYYDSMIRLGDIYYDKGDYIESKNWYLRVLEQIDVILEEDEELLSYVYYRLGSIYNNDDKISAMKYLKLAAELGHVFSQFLVGMESLHDEYGPANYSEAVKWLSKAAEQGDLYAYDNLGNIYESEKYGYKNISEAIRCYKFAADNDNELGLYDLGRCYENGIGVPLDYTKALDLYKKSAAGKMNVGFAMMALGNMYYNGRGVTKDIDEAKRWYQSAADNDNKDAKEKLDELKKGIKSTTENGNVQYFSSNESEYLETLKEYLTEGEISDRERRTLEKLRAAYGISEERAKELENSLKTPQLTENEKEYFEEYKSLTENGELSDKERRVLNKLRVAYGISEERARELEGSSTPPKTIPVVSIPSAGNNLYNVILIDIGSMKSLVMDTIKRITSIDLKEVMDLVNKVPANIIHGIALEKAVSIKQQLENAGAKVEIFSDLEIEMKTPENKTSSNLYDVVLKSAGSQKLPVVKLVKDLTDYGLKEAKDLVDSVPANIACGISKEKAESIKRQLERIGANVEIRSK